MQYKEMIFTKIEIETPQLVLKRCSVVYDDSWCTKFKIFLSLHDFWNWGLLQYAKPLHNLIHSYQIGLKFCTEYYTVKKRFCAQFWTV